MIVRFVRRSFRPTLEMSRPSTMILPSHASTKRKNESARVLFPQPVMNIVSLKTQKSREMTRTGGSHNANLGSRRNDKAELVQYIGQLGRVAGAGPPRARELMRGTGERYDHGMAVDLMLGIERRAMARRRGARGGEPPGEGTDGFANRGEAPADRASPGGA